MEESNMERINERQDKINEEEEEGEQKRKTVREWDRSWT